MTGHCCLQPSWRDALHSGVWSPVLEWADKKIAVDSRVLILACQQGDQSAVELLLSLKASPNVSGFEVPLLIAAKKGYKGICRALIKAGADVHRLDQSWRTAAEFAEPELANLIKNRRLEDWPVCTCQSTLSDSPCCSCMVCCTAVV